MPKAVFVFAALVATSALVVPTVSNSAQASPPQPSVRR
jgi:hypothetical protein